MASQDHRVIPDKQVTLPLGCVARPVGIARIKDNPDDDSILIMEDRQGWHHWVLRSVIEAMPVTYNRNEMP